MENLILLKLGGSAITQKNRNLPAPNLDCIHNAVENIKRARQEKDFRLIVIHGAGPYGHKTVNDYGIDQGISSSRHIAGFLRTRQAMEELNGLVLSAFRRGGLRAFPIQPSACIIQENKQIVSFDTAIVRGLLELDASIIPVMYGDMVIDRRLGASVVSGDAIITWLAKKLKARRVLFGADVAGIFSADPKRNAHAELIPEIDDQNMDAVLQSVSGSSNVDVTGGMRGKLENILSLFKGLQVQIFELGEGDTLYKALTGQPVTGTIIRMDPA